MAWSASSTFLNASPKSLFLVSLDGAGFGRKSKCTSPNIIGICGCLSLLSSRSASLLCSVRLCFMLLFALVCPVVGWCCRSRLFLCSRCFAAISSWTDASPSCCLGGCLAAGVASVSALRQRLCCGERDGPPSADALPLLWSSSLADALPPCYSSSGCFAVVVSSLADALPLIVVLAHLADALPSRLMGPSPGGCATAEAMGLLPRRLCGFTTLLATSVL